MPTDDEQWPAQQIRVNIARTIHGNSASCFEEEFIQTRYP